MIRVLIAEDSPAVQRVLVSLLQEEEGIEIVGVVNNGAEAVRMCRKLRPDLVTMDIFMPEMDGLEATKRIMDEHPTRIVIISSMVNSKDLRTSFEAMCSGAVEVIEKPHGVLSGNYSKVKETLIRIIRELMPARPQNRFSWVSGSPWALDKVKQPQTRVQLGKKRTPSIIIKEKFTQRPLLETFVPKIICIGGSTGAPAVLSDILSPLPEGFPVPIVVAQHIARGFLSGMVEWLNSSIKLNVQVARAGDLAQPGMVIFAPDDAHLGLFPGGRVALIPAASHELYTPSVNIFFESAAKAYGRDAMGIILSGMGSDGAAGLLKLRETGAVTIGQNEFSSVIYGMPKEALLAGAVLQEMAPPEMIELLSAIGKRKALS